MTVDLTSIDDGMQLEIPAGITDNASFLRWAEAHLEEHRGKIGFFQGLIWIDQTMETLLHNQIKMAVALAVMNWARERKLGQFYGDGMLFSRPEIELSSEPDGMFVSKTSEATRQVWFEKGRDSLILFGTPDMVLEVISKSSRKKDTKILPALYHQAGVSEYWLIDSVSKTPELVIHRHSANGYEPVPSQDGWVPSEVLGASFRLVIDPAADEVRLDRRA